MAASDDFTIISDGEKISYNPVESRIYVVGREAKLDLQRIDPDLDSSIHVYAENGADIRVYSTSDGISGNTIQRAVTPPYSDIVTIFDSDGSEKEQQIVFTGPAYSFVLSSTQSEAPDAISLLPLNLDNSYDSGIYVPFPKSVIGIRPDESGGKYLKYSCIDAQMIATIDIYNENVVPVLSMWFIDVPCSSEYKMHVITERDLGINVGVVDESTSTILIGVYITPLGDMHIVNSFEVSSGSPVIELGNRMGNNTFMKYTTFSCDVPMSASSPCSVSYTRGNSMLLPHEDPASFIIYPAASAFDTLAYYFNLAYDHFSLN
ncbi:hypothetical protein ADUPG1_012936, partial [Aduncisulcus paluster]